MSRIHSRLVTRLLLLVVVGFFATQASHAQFENAKIEFFPGGNEHPKSFSEIIPVGKPLADPVVRKEAKGETQKDTNVFFRISWPTPLAEDQRASLVIMDDQGRRVTTQGHPFIDKGATSVSGRFILKRGGYSLRLASSDDEDQVYVQRAFKVVDEAGKTSEAFVSNSAKIWICEDTDDNLAPLRFTGDPDKRVFNWSAGKDFNILVVNPKPFNVNQLLTVIHRQNADGTDGRFVSELQTTTLEDTTSTWASSGGVTEGGRGLEPGRYTVYVIDVYKRDVSEHNGNFTDYFAKATLIVR
jgi:hypothetical protein